MKPIEFKEHNVIYAKNQPEYLPLPAFKDREGIVITCWKLTFIERIRAVIKGNIWLRLASFNKPLTPSFLSTKKSDVLCQKK